MELYKKNRLLFWALIFLIVINLSALVSIFVFKKVQSPPVCRESPSMSCSGFCEELKLSDNQSAKVEHINQEYRSHAEPLVSAIKEKRSEILDELNNTSPDTTLLNRVTIDLTVLQTRLQRENIKQYLELKSVCTPEQVQRLSALYRDLYGCPMKATGNQHRHRGGQGKPRCQ